MPDTPQRLGKYLIHEELGRGGFGTVYRATDTTLDRVVALKILDPLLVRDPGFLERFRREAVGAARLEHPNIVPVYEVGEADGRSFIAMKYLPGRSLDKLLAEGRLPIERTLHILIQIAAALDFAHSKGIIHRDVKPSNVIVGADEASGDPDHATLTDFGLARATDQSMLTSLGQALGTPAYMAPEQLDVDRQEEVGPASDVYSFAVVAYEMLAGRPPFVGPTPAVMAAHLTKEPPPLNRFVPGMPVGVWEFLRSALTKESAQRPGEAAAIVRGLQTAFAPPAAAIATPEVEAAVPVTMTESITPEEPKAASAEVSATSQQIGRPEAPHAQRLTAEDAQADLPRALASPVETDSEKREGRHRPPTVVGRDRWSAVSRLAWIGIAVAALAAVVVLLLWKPWEPSTEEIARATMSIPVVASRTTTSATPTATRTATRTRTLTPTFTPTATQNPAPTPTAAPIPAPTGFPQPAANSLAGECTICHARDGANHQTYYNQLYQDGVIRVTDVKYAFTANPDTTTITFNMTMNGRPFDPAKADNLSIYWAPYARGKFQFEPAVDRLSLKGKISSDGKGSVISKLVELAKDNMAFVDYTDLSKVDGLIVIYGRDETQGTIPGTRVAQAKYPFAAIAPTGAGVNYVSPANVAGCVKCHTDPYLKHGYIYGQINRDPKTDFQTCKACHLDNGEGGHYEWQLLVNDPLLAARFLAEPDAEKALAMLTDAQKKEMAYKTTVMNDVHMSHAMEFPYPQSMSNCVTCHEGKLEKILTDANFTVATCKSCHPVTGAKAPVAKEGDEPAWDTTGLALKTILPEASHGKLDLATTDCTMCHKDGGVAASFKQIHTGYDKAIYTAAGMKYSDAISVAIDSATFGGSRLSFTFSATESPDIEGVNAASITPTVLVGLYGWDTKDFLYGPHERTFDDNKDGVIDSRDARNLEAALGDAVANPRLTIKSTGAGEWEAVADLSTWAPQIADGSVKRVEIGVLTKAMAGEVQVAVDAATRTFELGGNAFNDRAFSPITQVERCESCHAALATSFHNPAYGGSVTACRMCHITKAGGSHLEMQSRSIDSYAHAIHSGQAFDVGSIDFKDPVQALHYEEHITMPYPTHGTLDCESCHLPATYNPPTQDKSLPGLLSASSKNESWGRNIGAVPAMVVGPGQRACGSCHRAAAINEDKAGDLVMLNQHFEQGGYMIPAGDRPADTLMGVISEVMALFK